MLDSEVEKDAVLDSGFDAFGDGDDPDFMGEGDQRCCECSAASVGDTAVAKRDVELYEIGGKIEDAAEAYESDSDFLCITSPAHVERR
jgi:hypothetical protein